MRVARPPQPTPAPSGRDDPARLPPTAYRRERADEEPADDKESPERGERQEGCQEKRLTCPPAPGPGTAKQPEHCECDDRRREQVFGKECAPGAGYVLPHVAEETNGIGEDAAPRLFAKRSGDSHMIPRRPKSRAGRRHGREQPGRLPGKQGAMSRMSPTLPLSNQCPVVGAQVDDVRADDDKAGRDRQRQASDDAGRRARLSLAPGRRRNPVSQDAAGCQKQPQDGEIGQTLRPDEVRKPKPGAGRGIPERCASPLRPHEATGTRPILR